MMKRNYFPKQERTGNFNGRIKKFLKKGMRIRKKYAAFAGTTV